MRLEEKRVVVVPRELSRDFVHDVFEHGGF